ncbi:hypothetical protein [Brevundimonas sp. LjRoot202]|uniref:hypothetical protein n=1 Tax=Brevundimonas sp. LjRoot202 TaxID=3342281 RepID=UPI003ECDE66C
MRKLRWLLVAVAVAVTGVVVAAGSLVVSERSLIIIENRSNSAVELSIGMANPGQFSWAGRLRPGERVIRTSRFSDNSFVTACRDETGVHQSEGGYVTNGWPQRIDIVVDGCPAVSVDVETLP